MQFQIHSFQSIPSTNLLLEQEARKGIPEGTVFVADEQTAGRGRLNHQWFSPKGRNLYFSLLLRPPACSPMVIPQLAILAGLSMRRTLVSLSPIFQSLVLKWPNDLWDASQRKLCGILCSSACIGKAVEYAIVGIGLNVNCQKEELPLDLQEQTSSLAILAKQKFDRDLVLQQFLSEFEADYQIWQRDYSLVSFLKEWNQHAVLLGKHLSIEQGNSPDITGIAEGLSPEGYLLVRDENHLLHQVIAGDAHIRRNSIR